MDPVRIGELKENPTRVTEFGHPSVTEFGHLPGDGQLRSV